jgi:microcystin-dependent protein
VDSIPPDLNYFKLKNYIMICYIGEIRIFAGIFAPQGWHFCDGSTLNIQGNEVLFALIGTTYGGDGRVNFKLPDLSSALPVGIGQLATSSGYPTNYTLGMKGGNNQGVALTTTNLPQHNHVLYGTDQDATSVDPNNNLLAKASGDSYESVNIYTKLTLSQYTTTLDSTTLSNEGENQPHANIQPYLSVNYIIATNGIFPS